MKGNHVTEADVVVWGKVGGLLMKLRFKFPDLGLGVVVQSGGRDRWIPLS